MGAIDDAAREFADEYANDPDSNGGTFALKFGKVTNVAAGNVVTVTTNDGEQITAVHIADAGYTPTVNDPASVLVVNNIPLILGRTDGTPTP